MRRLLVVVCLLFGVVAAGTAFAALDKKLQRAAADSLDPHADAKARKDARQKFTDYFSSKRKMKELADVAGLAEILANAGKPAKRHRGEVTLEFDSVVEGEKVKVLVSIPRKYDLKGSSWPLIFCVPDKGESAKDYLAKYWGGKPIRDAYLIAVLEFDYSEVEVEERETVKEEGDVKIVRKIVKKPFAWSFLRAQGQWWRSLLGLIVFELKVDPNRVILDGAGLGATGNLSFSVGTAWRFAGLIDRGGEYDGAALGNLRTVKVLSMPLATASEKAGATTSKLKESQGDNFTAGTNEPKWSGAGEEGTELLAWLSRAVRQRYPLPATWTYTEDLHQIGHWVFITKVFDTDKPASITISGDLKTNVITIGTENVKKFDLYLNDLLVNLDKPFKIEINDGEAREYVRARSADDLLKHASVLGGGEAPWDPGCVFTAEVKDLVVSGGAAADEDKRDRKDDAKKGGK